MPDPDIPDLSDEERRQALIAAQLAAITAVPEETRD